MKKFDKLFILGYKDRSITNINRSFEGKEKEVVG